MSKDMTRGKRRWVSSAAAALIALGLGGCVERSLMIRSEPAGARIVVNGKDMGLTPVQMEFQTYGTFDVMLSAPGHHRLNQPVRVRAPWFQQAPLDFFTEMLWPFTIEDNREVLLTLDPYPQEDDAAVEGREAELRTMVEEGTPLQ